MKRLKVAVFGSTGSIGTQTLDVIREYKDIFEITALTADANYCLLSEQITEFKPSVVRVKDEQTKYNLEKTLSDEATRPEILYSESSLVEILNIVEIDIAMLAITGFAAFPVLVRLLESGKSVALANKESLIVGGSVVHILKERYSSKLIPVDSEHNSIFQCIAARPKELPRRVMITASGGPFLNYTKDQMGDITPSQAIKHPRWNMGAKISVDSATLMNKALEVIEAIELFRFPPEIVEIVVHPQHVIHAMLEYHDGSTHAIMYDPDMRVPITNAILACSNLEPSVFVNAKFQRNKLNFIKYSNLEFSLPDEERFPCLRIAKEAQKIGGDANIILNWSNEVAVGLFLDSKIKFLDIPVIIEKAISFSNSKVVLLTEADVYKAQKNAVNLVDKVVTSHLHS